VVTSDVTCRDSVLSQDSLDTHFGCLGLGLEGCCLVKNMVVTYIDQSETQ